MTFGRECYDATSWFPTRISPTGRGGMVGAKRPQAAAAGAAMLEHGGNAIDAAVATAFAVGVCEPWMNGIGGGGYMTVWLADRQQAVVVDYPMLSPRAASPEMFELEPISPDDDLGFGWPTVVGNRNSAGASSVCVPGTVAGLARALEEFGTMSLPEVMAPAIEIAREGFPLTWYETLVIAKDSAMISQYPETAKTFFNSLGLPKVTVEQIPPTMIRQPELAVSLELIAEQGPDVFYSGAIGERIVSYLQEAGSLLTADDFANYTARVIEPIRVPYHDHDVYTPGNGTGGTSIGQALTMLNELSMPAPEDRTAADWHRLTQVFRQAFADRFTYLADPDHVPIPQDTLLDPEYARECLATLDDDRLVASRPGSRERLGVTHDMPGSVPEYMRDGSTTHLGVIDADGNAVSLTQTLLGVFGSRVTVPGTGVLLNNGMMWFDPEPGRPNSVGGSKRPLSNMAPAVVVKDGQALASVGASGGRKIQNCNVQIIMNIVDSGMDAQAAIDAPRIDTSQTPLVISSRVPVDVRDDLAAMGHDVSPRYEHMMVGDFSSPVAIRRTAHGVLDGGADAFHYPATITLAKR